MRRPLPRLVIALLLALMPVQAAARDLAIRIADPAGKRVEDAVVMLEVPQARAAQPGRYLITQKDLAFIPLVLVIPVGSTIDFGNLDQVRHHVYSFSPARKFELKLFGHGEKHPVRFDKPGLVAIGCNIHDSMQAFIQVVETPFAAKTAKDGTVVLRDVPPGSFKLRIYHPRLRAPANELALSVDTRTTASLPITVRLRPPAPKRHDY